MKRSASIIVGFIFFGITINAFGINNREYVYTSPYFGIITGIDVVKSGKQQIDTSSGIDNGYMQYLPGGKYYESLMYGISGGYELKLDPTLLLSLGLGVYQNPNVSSKGEVWYLYSPDTTSNSHVFNYKYKIQSTRIILETQISFPITINEVKLMPFVQIGLGPSLNFLSSYEESIADPDAYILTNFQSKLNISVAYQFGLGISCPFNDGCDRLSLGYKYANLGKSYFNSRSDYTYKLGTGNVLLNEVYLSYSHYFDF